MRDSKAHFGPEWFWDQTRPEAIAARSQIEESHNKLLETRRLRLANQERQEILEHSAARHFLLAAKHFCLSVFLLLRCLRISPKSHP